MKHAMTMQPEYTARVESWEPIMFTLDDSMVMATWLSWSAFSVTTLFEQVAGMSNDVASHRDRWAVPVRKHGEEADAYEHSQ